MLALGGVLLTLVFYDAVVTTLATSNAAGPLTARLGRDYWRLSRRLASGPRSVVAISAGPVVLLLTVGAWLLLLWAGWGLVFAAEPSAVVSRPGGEPADAWSRVYFAGFVTFTLGVGDYAPAGGAWQVLTVVATMSGLGLTTAAISYFVPVVSAVTERRKQASHIAAHGQDAAELVLTGWHDHSLSHLEQLLPQIADGLLLTAERHVSYPILHYFQPSSLDQDLRVQMMTLDDAVSLLALGIEPAGRPHPATLRITRAAIEQLVERAAHTRGTGPTPPAPDLGRLREAGLPTVDDDTFARRLEGLAEHRRSVATHAAESLRGPLAG